MAEVMEKAQNFIFWSKYFVLFENWKHSLCHQAKYISKRLGLQYFLVMENSSKSYRILLPNFCLRPVLISTQLRGLPGYSTGIF